MVRLILHSLLLATLLGCAPKNNGADDDIHVSSDNTPNVINYDSLFTDRNDFGVQILLKQHDVYQETLSTLKTEKGMNEAEAEEFLKSMIKNGLLDRPQIIYINDKGERTQAEVSYAQFKQYIRMIKRTELN